MAILGALIMTMLCKHSVSRAELKEFVLGKYKYKSPLHQWYKLAIENLTYKSTPVLLNWVESSMSMEAIQLIKLKYEKYLL